MSNSERSAVPNPASNPGPSFGRLRLQAIVALVPFFMDGSSSDPSAIQAMIEGLLDEYQAATPKELQLATQIVADGWAVLGCLRTAAAAKNLSMDQVFKLQDDALALNRSSLRGTKALEAARRQRKRNPNAMTPENTNWDEGAFQLAINKALDKLNNANAKLAAYMATLAPVEREPKLDFLFAEPMTPSVLARRSRH